ncbi:glycosyltransferase [Halomarina ordinaria]|uniref:Glycosyltransferase n=1 Tax=Halomarina ordinaria TaxID=3033939 RepID=A0ABD5U7F3_9EURY|nr:glycosyltransferase [Halomarina sp. PSRA2]
MRPEVAVFTDTYLPTVNGVTYTIEAWRDCWERRGGRMGVVYPGSDHVPSASEHPVTSVPFPFYEGFHVGLPRVPAAVRDADLVHSHTPFGIGLAGYRLARRRDVPFIVSFHTPTSEYASYLFDSRLAAFVERVANGYETRYLNRADHVVTPSQSARARLLDRGVEPPITVVSNGIDVDRFAPSDGDAFREAYDLPSGPLVGYTGRHGYEKRLEDVVDAAEGLDVSVVFGGDGPARAALETRAAEADIDVRFLGFLDRDELPAFYSALDAFVFPSPVETQGLVALEAIACGTPVVAVDAGALADTVEEGSTGYHYAPGDVSGFRAAIRRTLDERARLRTSCLVARERMSVERAVDTLESVYRVSLEQY